MVSPPSTGVSGLAGDVLLVFVPTPEAGLSWPDAGWIAATEARHPGLHIRWPPHEDPATGKPRAPEELPADVWEGVTLLCSSWAPPARLIPNVRFIQAPSAGADRWLQHESFKDARVTLCTGNGTHA